MSRRNTKNLSLRKNISGPEEFSEALAKSGTNQEEFSSSTSSKASGPSREEDESGSDGLDFDEDEDEYDSEFDYEGSVKSFSSLICSTNEYLKEEEEKNSRPLPGLDLKA